jgi:Transposase DDE domain
MTSLEELFCHIDDFCQSFEPRWQETLLGNGLKHRQRRRALSLSEVMTILVSFHHRRISSHRVFDQLAARGKTSVDWFFGFKLHVVVNEYGELINFTLTPGNTDDRKPVPQLLAQCFGKVFADRGYVSKKLAEQLFEDFGINF